MRSKLYLFFVSCLFIPFAFCQQNKNLFHSSRTVDPLAHVPNAPEKVEAIIKSEQEWEEILTKMEYYVLRKAGTERAFSGDLWNHKEDVIYTCAGCELPLFDANAKFKSGTGWPSFYQPVYKDHVKEHIDNTFGMERIEVVCARCEGHLGHVFEDGPKPTGLRYCINSVSLNTLQKDPKK